MTAYDRANTTQLATGTLATVDNQIDTTTGTVKLRAIFANADDALFPNQFVNARLLVDTLHDVVTGADRGGADAARRAPIVYVVERRQHRVGAAGDDRAGRWRAHRGDHRGLQPGERVVTDGADRLRDGAKVTVTSRRRDGAAGRQPAPAASARPAADGDSAAASARPHRRPQRERLSHADEPVRASSSCGRWRPRC